MDISVNYRSNSLLSSSSGAAGLVTCLQMEWLSPTAQHGMARHLGLVLFSHLPCYLTAKPILASEQLPRQSGSPLPPHPPPHHPSRFNEQCRVRYYLPLGFVPSPSIAPHIITSVRWCPDAVLIEFLFLISSSLSCCCLSHSETLACRFPSAGCAVELRQVPSCWGHCPCTPSHRTPTHLPQASPG